MENTKALWWCRACMRADDITTPCNTESAKRLYKQGGGEGQRRGTQGQGLTRAVKVGFTTSWDTCIKIEEHLRLGLWGQTLNEKEKNSVFKAPSDPATQARERCSCLPPPTPPETPCRCCQHQLLSSCPSEPNEMTFDCYYPISTHICITWKRLHVFWNTSCVGLCGFYRCREAYRFTNPSKWVTSTAIYEQISCTNKCRYLYNYILMPQSTVCTGFHAFEWFVHFRAEGYGTYRPQLWHIPAEVFCSVHHLSNNPIHFLFQKQQKTF